MKIRGIKAIIRKFSIIILALFVCLSSIMFISVPTVEGTVQAAYYVSPSGDDSNPGTLSQPFATMSQARRIVRTINSNMSGDIYVYIMPGDYYIESTIDFNEEDSGTNGYNVIYKSYSTAGSAHFIGGQPVTGWEQYSGSIYRTDVGLNREINTLYENRQRAVKARYPNYTLNSEFPSSQGPYLLSEGVTDSHTVLQYKSGDLDPTGWDISDAQAYIWSGADAADAGYTDTVPISIINTATRQITFQESVKCSIGSDSRYFIQGMLQLLDQPGEFYMDSDTGYLYYWPRDGAINNQKIIAPIVKSIITIKGRSEEERVQNLQFEGLSFEDTEFTDWYRKGWVDAGDAALETEKQIVDLGGFTQAPVVDPHGLRVYFQSDFSGMYHWYRCLLDGSELENITCGETINENATSCAGDQISPHGGFIAYNSRTTIGRIAFAYDDGSQASIKSPTGQYCYMAGISPYGTDIAFSNNALGYKVQRVHVANGAITDLAPNLPNSYMPRYTPNGQKIIFMNMNSNIYSVNPDGTGLTNLTDNNLFYYEWHVSSLDDHGASQTPSISPDSSKIAYPQLVNGIPQIFVMNIDGTGKTQLTNSATPCVSPGWSPDGTKIAYVSRVGSYYWQLFTMNSTGGEVAQETSFDGCVRNYSWTPDSRQIVYCRMVWGSGEWDPDDSYGGSLWKTAIETDAHTYDQYDTQIEMTQHRTGMVYMENTDHVAIQSCNFLNSGYSGIYMLNYNQYNTVYGNQFQHMGYSGVYLEGGYPGEGNVLKYNTISNNLISDIGELVGHAAGIYVMNSSSNEVSYSEIFNSPKYAVAWGAYPDIPNASIYSKNNTFSYLRIHDCCQDSKIAGALYSRGSSNDAPSTTNTVSQVTIDNIYANSSITNGSANGIFMDTDSYGQTFTNVKTSNTQSDAFHNNNSGSHTSTNVNWTGSFNDSSLDYNNIGLKSDYVYPRYLPYDGFENGTGKWTAAKGTPSISTAVKRYGSKSYTVNENMDVIYQKSDTSYNTIASVWFYDDASDTTVQCMARVDNGDWDDSYSWRGLGVDSISSGYYSYRVGVTSTATSIPRTTGWHQLKWDYTSGTKVDMYIDNICVASPTGITSFDGIAMGDWWNDNCSGTNYFDDFSVNCNPIPNSSFESADNNNQPTDWTDYFPGNGGYSLSTEMAFNGSKSLKIEDTGLYMSVGATTPNIPATAGKYYESTVYCYASSATQHFSYYIQYFDTNGTCISENSVYSSMTGSWERLRIYAQAPAGTVSIKLLCYSYGANIGTGYFDLATFNESVSNQSFESENGNHEPTDWEDYFPENGGYSVSSEMAIDGDKSLKITDNGLDVSIGATTSNIPAIAGEYYESTVTCYTVSATEHFGFYMQYFDTYGEYISENFIYSSTTGSWERLRIYAQAPTGTTSIKLLCYSYGANIGTGYFDLITFKKY